MRIGLLFAVLAALPGYGGSFADATRPRSGEQVVQYQCILCHGQGLSGAPKIGDRKAWSARAHEGGVERLVSSASRGRGAMPPSGGLADLSEPELRAAIVYMLKRSGVESAD